MSSLPTSTLPRVENRNSAAWMLTVWPCHRCSVVMSHSGYVQRHLSMAVADDPQMVQKESRNASVYHGDCHGIRVTSFLSNIT
jgi:hypothetical protein